MSKVGSLDMRVLMQDIGNVFTFVPEKYPALKGASKRDAQVFAVRHSLEHMVKTAGKIAAVLEEFDHSGQMHYDNLEIETAKMTINALNLANALGMSAEELAAEIRNTVK